MKTIKPVSLAIGAAFLSTFALSQSAFAMSDLSHGYMSAAGDDAAKAEKAECKCGEGKFGADKAAAAGDSTAAADSKGEKAEGKCGEGKRSKVSRVREECVITCGSRWSQDH